jgi:cathepsin D
LILAKSQLTKSRNNSKLQRGFNNFEKNTGAPHSRARKLQKRATGTVPLTDDFDGSLWQGAITVGTPPVTFTGKE